MRHGEERQTLAGAPPSALRAAFDYRLKGTTFSVALGGGRFGDSGFGKSSGLYLRSKATQRFTTVGMAFGCPRFFSSFARRSGFRSSNGARKICA